MFVCVCVCVCICVCVCAAWNSLPCGLPGRGKCPNILIKQLKLPAGCAMCAPCINWKCPSNSPRLLSSSWLLRGQKASAMRSKIDRCHTFIFSALAYWFWLMNLIGAFSFLHWRNALEASGCKTGSLLFQVEITNLRSFKESLLRRSSVIQP